MEPTTYTRSTVCNYALMVLLSVYSNLSYGEHRHDIEISVPDSVEIHVNRISFGPFSHSLLVLATPPRAMNFSLYTSVTGTGYKAMGIISLVGSLAFVGGGLAGVPALNPSCNMSPSHSDNCNAIMGVGFSGGIAFGILGTMLTIAGFSE